MAEVYRRPPTRLGDRLSIGLHERAAAAGDRQREVDGLAGRQALDGDWPPPWNHRTKFAVATHWTVWLRNEVILQTTLRLPTR